jgi:hypothetical protein
MALEESQDWSWVARGWEAMSFFVCFLYVSKTAENNVSKFGEEVEVDGTWDIMLVIEGAGRENNKVAKDPGDKGTVTY